MLTKALATSSPQELVKASEALAKVDIDAERMRVEEVKLELVRLYKAWQWWRSNFRAPQAALKMLIAKYRYSTMMQELSEPTFKSIKQLMQEDEILCNAIIGKLLNNLPAYFNLGANIRLDQNLELMGMVIETCKGLTPEDVAVCFHKAKKGHYGQLYRLDGQVIMGWLEKYKEERRQRLAAQAQNRHMASKTTSYERTSKRSLNR